jgi:hypothetical protein
MATEQRLFQARIPRQTHSNPNSSNLDSSGDHPMTILKTILTAALKSKVPSRASEEMSRAMQGRNRWNTIREQQAHRRAELACRPVYS